MSDLARLTAGLARRLGAERVLDLGIDPARKSELTTLIEVTPAAGGDPAGALVVCDDPPRDSERLEPLLARLGELLATASAALLSAPDAVLAGDSAGWTAAGLERRLADAGLASAWCGLTDAHGSLGRRAGITCALAGTSGPEALEVLAGGPLGLAFDPAVAGATEVQRPPRVCIATYEFVGPTRTGGIGTAYTSLAEALAGAGHEVTVLFTGWPDPDGEPVDWWTGHYAERGIELVGLPPYAPAGTGSGHRHADRSLQAYRWLRDRDHERPFDVIHFPEVLGHGYYTTAAKRLGVAFPATQLVLGTHSSTTWVLETNGTLIHAVDDFADDFVERASIAGADAVVSPSAYMLDWMRSRGWRLPERSFVQQYVRSAAADAFAADEAPAPAPAGPTELVFFGRLEPRKGLRVFCDALNRLAELPEPPDCRVTLLGKHSSIDGEPAGDWVRRRARRWPWQPRLIEGLNQPQAVEYLRAPGRRLTVIPSLADNSPNTVYEALALRIPFIASRVGGTAELIDPRDLETATFDPLDGGPAGGAALAERLAAAIAAPELRRPRPAVDAAVCRRAHVDWHVALAGADGGADGATPDAAAIEVWAIGSDAEAAELTLASAREGGIGTARAAATHAEAAPSGEVALFVLAGTWFDAGASPVLARALARSRDGIVATAIGERGPAPAQYLPVGGPATAGLFRRCFGDPAFAIRTETLAGLGGFDAGVPADMQAHHLLCRAAVGGLAVDVLPEALVSIDAERLPPLELAVASRRVPQLIDVYRDAGEPLLSELPLLAQQLWAAMRMREGDYSKLYGERFGRYTVQARFFIHHFRLLQKRWARLRRRAQP